MKCSMRMKGAALLMAAAILTVVGATVPHGGGSSPQAKHHHGINRTVDNDRSGAEAGESLRRDWV